MRQRMRTLRLAAILIGVPLTFACGASADEATSENDVSALSAPAKYENDEGCLVTVEPHAGQVLVMVDKGTERADFGYRPDLSSGDITAFCSSAVAKQAGAVVTIFCDAQRGDGVPTRGTATMKLSAGLSSVTTGGLEAVTVVGEKKGWFFWSADTDISCTNLRLRR